MGEAATHEVDGVSQAEREWLEAGKLDHRSLHANLLDLERMNRLLGGTRSVTRHLLEIMAGAPRGRPFRVLDVACGGGDLLRLLAQAARGRGLCFLGVGVDVNEDVISFAKARSEGQSELQWVRAEAERLPFQSSSFDVVMSSLFLHHLQPKEVADFLTAAAVLASGWLVVGDLVKAPQAERWFRLAAVALRLHPVTRHDGALSLRRAYRPEELARLAEQAGLREWQLYRHRFFRMTLIAHT